MKKVISFLLAAAMVFSMSSIPAMANTQVAAATTSESDTDSSETPDYVGSFQCEEVGDGIILHADGTFVAFTDFEKESGKAIGTYEVDGSKGTFYSPYLTDGQQTGTWDGKNWTFGGDTYSRTIKILSLNLAFYDLYINDDITILLGNPVESIEKDKMKTTADLETTMVEPGEVYTVDIKLKRATAQLQAINPYEKAAPLGKCMICSFYTEDTSKTFAMDSEGHHCGEKNFDDLLTMNAYSYTEDTLVYKTYLMSLSSLSFSDNSESGKLLLTPSGDADLTLKFNGSTLTSFQYTFPDLLYNGLNDNMDAETLADMDAAKIEEATTIRGNILDDLKKEFKAAHVDAQMDEQTGEIIMDNEVLFNKNSYEISDEGKEYLDAFIGAYGAVIFSDDYIDNISEIHFEGHTDSDGDYGYNQILSQKRAEAVLEYCLTSENNGLTDDEKDTLEEIAVTTGYSCANPVYDEEGNEDKDASRRAVVKFYIDVE